MRQIGCSTLAIQLINKKMDFLNQLVTNLVTLLIILEMNQV